MGIANAVPCIQSRTARAGQPYCDVELKVDRAETDRLARIRPVPRPAQVVYYLSYPGECLRLKEKICSVM